MCTKLLLRLLIVCLSAFIFCSSCKKFLDAKSVQTLSTPSTVNDLQAILDNPTNRGMIYANSGSDEFYLTSNDWLGLGEFNKDGYVWAANFENNFDWSIQYNLIFYANTVLYNLPLIKETGSNEALNAIKGSALFYRGYSFYNIAQLYASQYDAATASSTLGIPLRLTADFNEVSVRASLQDTYNQIINDFQTALPLITDLPKIPLNRPSKAACYAMLAKTYLQMGDYQKAKENADASLQLYSTILDFNDNTWIDPTSATSILNLNNPEILFYSNTDVPINATSSARIDSTLYNMYDGNDLRKSVYFLDNGDGSYQFKGSYNVNSYDLFSGVATDEVILIRAECYARLGDATNAILDLNTLIEKRFITGTFIPYIVTTPDAALDLIIIERKKELVYRGTRWADLKRLNKESKYQTTLVRNLEGTDYQLPPNDNRYTLLIPREVIRLTNMTQNPR